MESIEGRRLHGLAEHAREQEQDFIKAHKYLDEAIVAYAKEEDHLGMSEAQGSRFIVYKHQYVQTGNRDFLILAILSARAAVLIAKENKIRQALPLAYFDLGKAYQEAEDYKEALEPLRQAFELSQKDLPERHNRPAVKSDIKAHLAFVEYMVGNKKAIKDLEEAIGELQDSDEYEYNKDVWLSGAHMRAAMALSEDDPKNAQEHLEKAEEIIGKNPELKLRAEQLKKLKAKLND